MRCRQKVLQSSITDMVRISDAHRRHRHGTVVLHTARAAAGRPLAVVRRRPDPDSTCPSAGCALHISDEELARRLASGGGAQARAVERLHWKLHRPCAAGGRGAGPRLHWSGRRRGRSCRRTTAGIGARRTRCSVQTQYVVSLELGVIQARRGAVDRPGALDGLAKPGVARLRQSYLSSSSTSPPKRREDDRVRPKCSAATLFSKRLRVLQQQPGWLSTDKATGCEIVLGGPSRLAQCSLVDAEQQRHCVLTDVHSTSSGARAPTRVSASSSGVAPGACWIMRRHCCRSARRDGQSEAAGGLRDAESTSAIEPDLQAETPVRARIPSACRAELDVAASSRAPQIAFRMRPVMATSVQLRGARRASAGDQISREAHFDASGWWDGDICSRAGTGFIQRSQRITPTKWPSGTHQVQ